MKFILWHFNRLFSRYRLVGLLSIFIIASTGVFHWLVLLPATSKLKANQATLHALQKRAEQSHLVSKKEKSPHDQLLQLYEFFPVNSEQTLSQALENLYVVANDHNLVIDKASYQLVTDLDNSLERYDTILPVKGEYTKLRQFITQLLRDEPYLSLDSVNFSRLSKEEPVVETQLEFSLYFRSK